ncbi:hypothetical protein K504DRAFT_463058 [Pleomassaria siparia CBS 279.74]|uniref:Uncharacterized protein n=1 Tax=Pleomassaria siparia CBS 279.74 TaxID=1314801 RepID=A0A6G1JTP8_9PLEO|nr:hypothetical protein K504DRAFT_463058 [Pleomassaria siparia CBS 279.74]
MALERPLRLGGWWCPGVCAIPGRGWSLAWVASQHGGETLQRRNSRRRFPLRHEVFLAIMPCMGPDRSNMKLLYGKVWEDSCGEGITISSTMHSSSAGGLVTGCGTRRIEVGVLITEGEATMEGTMEGHDGGAWCCGVWLTARSGKWGVHGVGNLYINNPTCARPGVEEEGGLEDF